MKQLIFNPPVIAHRGASAYAPENTMAAFNKAVELKARWIEFDVMLANCGTPIVFHDETLERTTNGKGRVCEFPYNYLKTLDAGFWFHPDFTGERIPTLDQVVAFINENGLFANVEIKPTKGQERETILATLEVINRYFPDQLNSIIFSSFSPLALNILREIAPDCQIGLLLDHWMYNWEKLFDSLECSTLNIDEKMATPEIATFIGERGKSLLCYTVNNKKRAEFLYVLGVTAIFSDFPDIFC